MEKSKKKDDKHNQFLGEIVYTNELPDLSVDCKFLPCGKDLLDYTIEPVSFPELEAQHVFHFKGLQSLFNLDLVNQQIYDQPLNPSAQMDPRDAAILNEIEALDCQARKAKAAALEHPRAQEFQLMFAKERAHVPRPRTSLQRAPPPPESKSKKVEIVSLQQQKQLINQTFKSIEKPLACHPTKPGSKAKPIAILPIFPDLNLQNFEFVQVLFDIPPVNIPNSLIKDCGSYLINFNAHEPANRNAEQNSFYYISDQRYTAERTAENAERGERFMLREKENSLYYIPVDRHIKLRRERPRPQSLTNKCLLQVKRVPVKKDGNKKKTTSKETKS
ncbi:RNA polymerase II-associated factor 1 homolog [Drosophila tropicalis]|uniref:RNA polymerase II-associated factor 1 homolog n=1 Tax=Drosophila tropicalis TaxID=46794 RepID=UPI0035AB8BB7